MHAHTHTHTVWHAECQALPLSTDASSWNTHTNLLYLSLFLSQTHTLTLTPCAKLLKAKLLTKYIPPSKDKTNSVDLRAVYSQWQTAMWARAKLLLALQFRLCRNSGEIEREDSGGHICKNILWFLFISAIVHHIMVWEPIGVLFRIYFHRTEQKTESLILLDQKHAPQILNLRPLHPH